MTSELISPISIYEVIGFCWVVLTCGLSTVAIFWLAYMQLTTVIKAYKVCVSPETAKALMVEWGRKEDGHGVKVR